MFYAENTRMVEPSYNIHKYVSSFCLDCLHYFLKNFFSFNTLLLDSKTKFSIYYRIQYGFFIPLSHIFKQKVVILTKCHVWRLGCLTHTVLGHSQEQRVKSQWLQ